MTLPGVQVVLVQLVLTPIDVMTFHLDINKLYSVNGLREIDAEWLSFLQANDADAYQMLNLIRSKDIILKKTDESKFIIKLSGILEDFLSSIFCIQDEVRELSRNYGIMSELYNFKRNFVQKIAFKSQNVDKTRLSWAKSLLGLQDIIPIRKLATDEDLSTESRDKLPFAVEFSKKSIHDDLEFMKIVKDALKKSDQQIIDAAIIYANCMKDSSLLFSSPKKIDFSNLIGEKAELVRCPSKPVDLQYALDQAGYCIKCHNLEKDTCSVGIKEKNNDGFQYNALDVPLNGCPLEQKISEMNELVANGAVLAAFAVVIIDNPMVAATGHRICNDCMKSCIYQKQDPVNIPAIESRVFNDILSLSWGFEIYSLLIKWNPLKWDLYLPRENNGYKVLVVGQGPAGFTISHYLLQYGYTVVGIDGLKIEPNPFAELEAIYDIKKEMFKNLDDRYPSGFGGVAEYGITARWEKNYLSVIRTLLERRKNFSLIGGVRFGSNLDYNDANNLGFDHIVLAVGAGKPKLLEGAKNVMAKGCKMASDFLMNLQSMGAYRMQSATNLEIRMPVLVIGGGLTAVDAATEALSYYQIQVEKLLRQYEIVGISIFDGMDECDKLQADEFLQHAKVLRSLDQYQDKIAFLKSLGGVKICYRKHMNEAPSYRLNHEELLSGLSEGVEFIENIVPNEILVDEFHHVCGLAHNNGVIAARTVLFALGTQPNSTLSREYPEIFKLNKNYFQSIDFDQNIVMPEKTSKPTSSYVITIPASVSKASVSFLGDAHPSFAGNVVKAIASAKRGVGPIHNEILRFPPINSDSSECFISKINASLTSTVHSIAKLSDGIFEVVVKSHMCAKRFKPGQFFKMQNYSLGTKASALEFEVHTMEPLAMTGAWVDVNEALVGMIVLEMGGSSNICKHLQVGQKLVLMGPTGAPTEVSAEDEEVLLIGGGLGNAVLFSIGAAFKNLGCKVTYFAGYKTMHSRFKVDQIQNASDIAIWCCQDGVLEKYRECDYSFQCNIIEGIKKFAAENLAVLKGARKAIVIGSDGMMNAVSFAMQNDLRGLFRSDIKVIGSINSPMQCMMKEICAQCLQRHVDVESGEEKYVYSCFNQDQDLNTVDFRHLRDRLKQNSIAEHFMQKYFQYTGV